MTGEESASAPAKPAEKLEEKRGEEKRPEEKKKGPWGWVVKAVIVIIAIIAIAYLTIGVVITEAPPAASYPYTTTYQVLFPASQVVTIGTTEIIAIPSETGNRVILSINKEPKEMGIGETRVVQERRAIISILFLKIMDFDFRVDATYQGRSGDMFQFYLAFRTSKQVPSFLIERLLPASVQARPV